jgi:hypothetical protein
LTHTGSQVKSRDQWVKQREYLKAMLTYYQYGQMPPRPKKITVKQAAPRNLPGGKATQIDFVITVHRAGKTADLRCALVRPKPAGKFPVIIKYGFRLLAKPDNKRYAKHYINDQAGITEAIARGYVVCKFLRSDIAADTPGKRSEGVIGLYPEYDCGAIAAWAWGYQIVIDALGEMEFVDIDKVVATGHSRGGKSALCAAIYDDRIAIAAPNSSGTGGTGSLRYFEKGQRPQRIAAHIGKFDHWWPKRFLQFAGKEKKLPFDAHFAKALIAPRGLINTHATEDYWANPYGTQLTHQAAKIVFDWLGAGDRIGIHWRPGGHAQTIEDWRALLDFSDAIFFKKKPARKFDKMHYKTAKPEINWQAPEGK